MHRVTMFAPIGMPSAIWLNVEVIEFFDDHGQVAIRPAAVKVLRSEGQPVYSLNDPHPHSIVYEGEGLGVVRDEGLASGKTYIYSCLVEWGPGLWHAVATLAGTAL